MSLLFGTLHDHGVDYVAIGGIGGIGRSAQSAEEVELTIERSFENCEALITALGELDAHILIDPRRPTPLSRRSHPRSLIAGEHRFRTSAGNLFLRDPDFIFGCPSYGELREGALGLPVDDEVEVRVASLRLLARIERSWAQTSNRPAGIDHAEGSEGDSAELAG